jgi:hypothetical protein
VDGDVSDLPEEAVNEESVATGDIDLPEEVANDELDDLFVDVTTASPKKEGRSLAKTHRGNKKHARVYPGPTAADIQATLVQGRAPDVEAYLGRSLGGALQDDVMEIFSPPRILEYTAIVGLREICQLTWQQGGICLWSRTGPTSSQRFCGGGRKLCSWNPLAPGSPSS